MRNQLYNRAVDLLQNEQFITELYVSKTHVTLRWFKGDARWHIAARSLLDLDDIGRNVIRWLDARDRGTSNESNFAVNEHHAH